MFRQLQTLSKKIISATQKYWADFKDFLNLSWRSTTNNAQIFWAKSQQSHKELIIAVKHNLNKAQNKIQIYYKQSITAKNTLYQKTIDIKNWIIRHHTTASDDIKHIGEHIKDYAFRKWTQYQPHIDEFSKWSMAVSATASTLKISVQILPIVMSMLGILAAGIPLVGFLFPQFFFTELALFTFVGGISLFAGYLNYKDQVNRAELDAKTEQHEETLAALEKRLKQIEMIYQLNPAFQPEANASDSKSEKAAMNDPDLSRAASIISQHDRKKEKIRDLRKSL